MKYFSLIALLLFLLISGCTSKYHVALDGLNDPEAARMTGTTYVLESETPGVENTDLFFKEVVRHLEFALHDAGYFPAQEGAAADIVIGVNAHLSEPMVETHSYSEPVYAHGRGHSYSVKVPVVNDEGSVVRYVNRWYHSGPSYYYAGSIERDRQYTVFNKVLQLSAKAVGSPEEIWNLKITLKDRSSDYRSSLPFMLVAAVPYIGGRTEGQEIIAVREDSPQVVNLIERLSDE